MQSHIIIAYSHFIEYILCGHRDVYYCITEFPPPPRLIADGLSLR